MAKIKASRNKGKEFYLNHLSADDYYSEKERVIGEWRGGLAREFGLYRKDVSSDIFSQFQQNINPRTHQKLTQRTHSAGIRFYDFQCSAQKSVSVMSLFDDRLIDAHREAVAEAMKELEKLAAVRVRSGDNVRTNNYETTSKIVYAEFHHDASRKLDPQLHTHNVVANVTQTEDGEYKALETLQMCRAIRYAGKVYQNSLAMRCRSLGYRLEKQYDGKGNITGFELAGVSEEVRENYSQRRQDIEAEIARFEARRGRRPTIAEVNRISLDTRSAKMIESDRLKVREHQLARLDHTEREKLEALANTARSSIGWAPLLPKDELRRELDEAVQSLYERESVLTRDKLLAEVMNRNLGFVEEDQLIDAILSDENLRNLGGDPVNPYYSTEEVIRRELLAIESVEDQQDIFEAINPDFQPFAGESNREKQAELIKGILSSKDRFLMFRGVAGSGKTSTLQELVRGLNEGGIAGVHLIAPTNSAVDVLKSEGFEQSQTVAAFLHSPEKPKAGSYVIIDESGLNSLREGVEIVKTARLNNFRVLFVGDARQHTAVESGDFFRLLEDHSRIARFELSDIHRQQNAEYRAGISECARGDFTAAFERFDRNGFIIEGQADYLEQATSSFMEYTDDGRSFERAVAVAPTHAEVDKLTTAIRSRLKTAGSLPAAGREAAVFRSWSWPKARLRKAVNFQPGMTVGFIRDLKGVAAAGSAGTVESVDGDYLQLDTGRRLYMPSAAEYIEAGELKKLELCPGDLIQFSVNIRSKRIFNGNIARITDEPGVVELVSHDGVIRDKVTLPEGFRAYRHGWVTTSHSAQGRTAENVVAAAQSLDRRAFYVTLSRGRKNMRLHCPDKTYLHDELIRRGRDRASVHDLASAGLIDGRAILPLSEAARQQKAKHLPDRSFLSWKSRLAKLKDQVAKMLEGIFERGKMIRARRARAAKYGHGLITHNTRLGIEREHAIEMEKQSNYRKDPFDLEKELERLDRKNAADLAAVAEFERAMQAAEAARRPDTLPLPPGPQPIQPEPASPSEQSPPQEKPPAAERPAAPSPARAKDQPAPGRKPGKGMDI